ncbi:invasion associated locus B family protein [Rhodobacteraceae bacterium M385]|nr:invasion associated locus B family protein [Rhodobacteraceae bacterium M385]
MAIRAGLLLVAMTGMATAQDAEPVRDTVGNWLIECVDATCVVSQTLLDAETNQRVVILTLQEAGADRMAGTLQLPFGLALQAGVQLSLGGVALDAAVPISTCMPIGCLVQLGFETDVLDGFASGDTLSVSVIIFDSGEMATFVLEMEGLSAARDRAASLVAG